MKRRRSGLFGNLLLVVTVIAAGLAIWGYGQFGKHTPPGKLDPKNVGAYMGRLARSQTPEAMAIKKEMASASADLARERAAARAEGVPIFPNELAHPPVAPERNAALVFSKLELEWKRNPVNSATSYLDNPLGSNYLYTPAQIATARKQLSDHAELYRLIREFAAKPECDFQRNWALGPAVLFPEYSRIRSCARLLSSSSYLLACDGKYQAAVDEMARGFALARHAGSDPVIIAYLVQIAVDAITLKALERMLFNPNADVSDSVRRAILTNPPTYNLRHAMEGETGSFLAGAMMQLRQQPEGLHGLIGGDEGQGLAASSQPKYSADERQFVLRLLDATEARELRVMRERMASARQPLIQRIAASKRLTDESEKPSDNPIDQMAGVFTPVFSQADIAEAHARAQRACLLAACDVMAYRARTGHWPAKLSDANPKPPLDPFTDKPLRYSLEKGGFVVYSVGSEGNFDGGKPGEKTHAREAFVRYPHDPPVPALPLTGPTPGMGRGGMRYSGPRPGALSGGPTPSAKQ